MTKRVHYCYLLTRSLPEGGCRYYVGIRTCPRGKTPEADTKYMGGGPWIKRAVKAHPGEFTKTIVEVFDTIAGAKALERALVGLTTANSPWSYNLCEGGGSGGLRSEETKAKVRAAAVAQHSDPERKARHAEATTAANRNLAQSPKWLAANAASHRTPKAKARNRELAKDPEWLAANAGAARQPARRAKVSANTTSWWANATDEQKAARVAAQQRTQHAKWARMTPEERSAEMKRRKAVAKAERPDPA